MSLIETLGVPEEGEVSPRKQPQPGTVFRQLFDILAEFPGVKCTTSEVAVEAGLTGHKTGSLLASMSKQGYVQQCGAGRGKASTRQWWVDA